nr:hypothetical protein GCM10020185_36660 [Pseudomonas brassicacearum subsp. brassicacearum]
MAPKVVKDAVCQEVVIEGDDVDLAMLPVQTCWPGDVAPLITWGLTVTKGPNKDRQNLGIYRQQVIGRNKVIMRWLSHRGGALDYREWCEKNTPASHSRCRWPWARTRRLSSAPSRRCPTASPNMRSPACCEATAPSW